MHLRKILIASTGTALLAWCSAYAQQSPTTPQNPSATTASPTAPGNPNSTEDPSVSPSSSTSTQRASGGKEKRLSGSLVDVKCMAKTLGGEPAPTTAPAGAAPQTPHFAESPDQAQQPGQTGGASSAGPAGASRGTAPTYPGQDSGQNPDMSQAQSARASAAAERMDQATKQCTATDSTQTFGLALSDGKVVQLDNEGNTKASQALKSVAVEPGKKIKAKVTGVVEANNMVQVASVEVKGKKQPSSSMGGPAGEVK